MKKVTSKDVADRAGVSQTTVSLILNNSPKNTFSDETRARVLQAVQELGYQHTVRAHSGDKKKNGKMLLVLIPTLVNPYYSDLVSLIEDYAEKLRYHVMVCNTFRKPDLEKYYLDCFAGSLADGIIYTFLPGYPHLVEQIGKDIPVVMIGEKKNDLNICSIELSNLRAGAMLAEHLISLGHRRFVFISTPINSMTLARSQRLEGIRMQLEKSGITDGLQVLTSEALSEQDKREDGLPYEYSIGRHLTAHLLSEGTDATALIGVNDMTAVGILNELHRQGLRVPRDFSVCGFDNIFSASTTTPGLTTIDHHLGARCESAVDMIVCRLEPLDSRNPYVSKIEYTPQLITRDSTGPAPRNRR